jgi:putative ABC transport system permease protein
MRALSGLAQDARYGVRLLRRQPGFAFLSVLTMAVGIGAASTLFSVTYGVLLRPYPWPNAGRLVRVSETRPGARTSLPPLMTNASFLAWRDAPATVEGLAAYDDDDLTLTEGSTSSRLHVIRTSAALFDVLGVRPALGAVFPAADETDGRQRVLVLSDGLWRSRFGGSSGVIGQTVRLDGEAYTIIGVMPRGFYFPTPEAQAWRPYVMRPVGGPDPNTRNVALFDAVALLREGVTPAQAAAEGTARSRSAPDLGIVAMAIFGTHNPPDIEVVPYAEAVTAGVRQALLALMSAVALLLATAVANVAGLQLVRAASRRREVALRASLGAGPVRLLQQLLTENAIVAVAGAIAGLGLAVWLHALLPRLLPADFPRIDDVVLDWHVVAFASAAAACATLAFGMLPAVTARRIALVDVLNDDSLAPVGGGVRSAAGRLRVLIMAGQVAVAVVLIVGASLLTRSVLALSFVDRGFEPRHLVTATLALPDYRFDPARRAAFVDTLLTRLREVPSVQHAAAANVVPLMQREALMAFQMPGPNGMRDVHAASRIVSPGYFAALGMRLVSGRDFTAADTAHSQPVAIVNQAFVREYLDGDPLAATLPSGRDDHSGPTAIVGIVDDVRQRSAADPPQPEIFQSYRQTGGLDISEPVIVVRTEGDPAAFVPALRSFVAEQDPLVVLTGTLTMDERLSASLARPRLYAVLLGTFAILALLVSGIGVFGVLSYAVAQRAREIGVRAALGATPRQIVALVLRQGLWATLGGVAAGLVAAALAAASLRSLLFGIQPYDAVSFLAAPAVLVAVAVVACIAPARRAARIDPLRALRSN